MQVAKWEIVVLKNNWVYCWIRQLEIVRWVKTSFPQFYPRNSVVNFFHRNKTILMQKWDKHIYVWIIVSEFDSNSESYVLNNGVHIIVCTSYHGLQTELERALCTADSSSSATMLNLVPRLGGLRVKHYKYEQFQWKNTSRIVILTGRRQNTIGSYW